MNLSINWCIKKIVIEDQIEVITAAHFLKKAEDNLIYVYYADFDEARPNLSLPSTYQKFADVFDEKAEEVLSPHQSELDHLIELLLNIIPLFRSLYNLSEEELWVLKNYIDQHLCSEFIICLKFSAVSLILFIRKKNDSLHLCVNYWALNVISVKNKYLISLISEILNHLNWA